MADVGTLTVRIQGDTETLVRSLKKAGVQVKGFSDRTKRATREVTRFQRGIDTARLAAAAFATVLGSRVTTAFTQALRKQIDFANELGNLNRRLGVTTEFLSQLRVAGEVNGVQFNTLAVAVQRATRRFAEIRTRGTGTATQALKLLGGGIEEAVLQGETLEALLPKIADRLAAMGDEQQRVLALFGLFDSEGVRFGQVLNQGSRALREATERMEKFGLVVTEDGARAAQEFNEALVDARLSIEGVFQALVQSETFADLATSMRVGADVVSRYRLEFSILLEVFLNSINAIAATTLNVLRLSGALEAARTNQAKLAAGTGARAAGRSSPNAGRAPLGFGGSTADLTASMVNYQIPQLPSPRDFFNVDDSEGNMWEKLQQDFQNTATEFDAMAVTMQNGAQSVGQAFKQGLGTLAVNAIFQTGDAMQTLQAVAQQVVGSIINTLIELVTQTVASESTRTAVKGKGTNARIAMNAAEGASEAAKGGFEVAGIFGFAIAAAALAGAIALIISSKQKAKDAAGTDFARGGIVLSEIRNANIGETAGARPEVIAPLKTLLPMIQGAVAGTGGGDVYLDGERLTGVLMPRIVDEIYFAGAARAGR